ncbi:MAG: hypothetical protein Q8N76_06430 [Candidatus Omnitrophota bacterium]|nr:hypothetical protein [Candidatus Omnitrophota bacterium]
MLKIAVILICGLIIIPAAGYAGTDSSLAAGATSSSFSEWVNIAPSDKQIDESTERIVIREQWERNLGIDIFSPYFKAKELESKMREKTSVRVLKLKGKAEFKNNEAKYIFKLKF